MRVLACAAALAAAPLVSSSALSDEVALLQKTAREQPAEGSGFKLRCDELAGCRYEPDGQTATTPAPYQLVCDEALGCRYTGLEPHAASPTRPPLLSVAKEEDLELMLNKLGAMAYKAGQPKGPKDNAFKQVDIPALFKDLDIYGAYLPEKKLPDFKLPGGASLPGPTLPALDFSRLEVPELSQGEMPTASQWLQMIKSVAVMPEQEQRPQMPDLMKALQLLKPPQAQHLPGPEELLKLFKPMPGQGQQQMPQLPNVLKMLAPKEGQHTPQLPDLLKALKPPQAQQKAPQPLDLLKALKPPQAPQMMQLPGILAKTLKAPKAHAQAHPQLPDLMKLLPHPQLPNLTSLAKKLEDYKQTLPEDIQYQFLPLPDHLPTPEDLEKWKYEYTGAFDKTAKLLAPNVTEVMRLVKLATPGLAATDKALLEKAQRQLDAKLPARFHLVSTNEQSCLEGGEDYLRQSLSRLRASPIGANYQTEVEPGKCGPLSYNKGPLPDPCFPQAQLWLSDDHPFDYTADMKLMAAYGKESGFASISQGVKELCGH